MPRLISGGIRLSPLPAGGPRFVRNPRKNTLGIRPGQPVEVTLLEEYRVERGLTIDALARQIGATRNAVRNWLLGSQLPSLPWAYRIDEATDGAVPPVSWLGTKLGASVYAEIEVVAEQRGSPSLKRRV